jgi:hypothetical protein
MDRLNEADMLVRYPEAASKMFLLATCDGAGSARDIDIADPNGQPPDTMRRCFALIATKVRWIADQLRNNRHVVV